MNDDFIEYLIKRKKSMGSVLTQVVFIILIGLTILAFPFLGGIGLLLAIILIAVYVAFVLPSTNVEFEYLYCDKTLSVDKILGQSRRKTVAEYQLEQMEIVAPVDSDKLSDYKNRDVKVIDYTSHIPNDEYKTYAIYYAGNVKILLDLPEKFAKMIQSNAPRKVFVE